MPDPTPEERIIEYQQAKCTCDYEGHPIYADDCVPCGVRMIEAAIAAERERWRCVVADLVMEVLQIAAAIREGDDETG